MNHEFWYLSRAAGFTAYGLLFLAVAFGIMIGTRMMGRFPRGSLFELHRFTSLLALAFTAFHVIVLLGDDYFSFTLPQLTVPFASPYRAWQTAAGVIAFYGFAVVIVSFYLRHRIGYRAWRALHFTTFALFWLAMLHGVTAGTDTGAGWAQAIYGITGVGAIVLVVYRVQHRIPAPALARGTRIVAGAAATIAAAALLFVAALQGVTRAPTVPSGSTSIAASDAPGLTAVRTAREAPAVDDDDHDDDDEDSDDDDEHGEFGDDGFEDDD